VATGGGLIALFVWLTRDNMAPLLIATALIGTAILIVRQLKEKRVRATNLTGMALLLLLTISVTRVVPKFKKPEDAQTAAGTTTKQDDQRAGAVVAEAQPINSRSGLAARVSTLRNRFIQLYPNSSSNIDSSVQLTSLADVIGYLPRAAAIGFFAPFPNMWLASGKQVGSAGRMLSGVESVAMYAVEGLALVGLWKGRRRFSLWLLVLTAASGVIALGLVVVNVGALYRLRYVLFILIITIAGKGITDLFDWLKKEQSTRKPPAGSDLGRG